MALGNLAALGAGFGAGMADIQRQSEIAQMMQMRRQEMARQQLQMQQQAQQQQSLAALWPALAAAYGQQPQLPQAPAMPPSIPPMGQQSSFSGLPGGFGQAIQQAESGGSTDPYLTSKAGAVGPRQMMPATFAENAPPGSNIYDPQQNIAASDRYIGKLSQQFGGNPELVAAAYNAGPRRVADSLKTGMPLPAETIKFVRNVTSHLPQPVQQAVAPMAAQMAPDQQQQSQAAAQETAAQFDPMEYGRLQMKAAVDALDKQNLDPAVKTMALLQLSKLMAPDQKMLMSMLLMRHQFDYRSATLKEKTEHDIAMEAQGAARGERQGWTPIQLPGNKVGRMNVATGEVQEIPEAAGATKLGGPGQTLPDELKYPDKWQGMPETPPPGVRQDVWNGTLFYVRTHQMPSLGFNPSMRLQILQASPAAMHALGIKPSEAPDIAAAYAGERHGEIVGGGRAAQIGLGLREAEQLGPTVKEAAKGIPATEFPSENKFLNWLNTQTGDPNIVRFRGALNSFLQTYTRTVGGTMSLTDFRLQHAYTLINDAMARGQINQAIDQLVYEMQVMGAAVPEAMRDLQQIGQPPATRAPANVPAMPGSQGGPIKLDANGNEIK